MFSASVGVSMRNFLPEEELWLKVLLRSCERKPWERVDLRSASLRG